MVFDVDGTLVDSERHGHRVAFNSAFAEEGLDYAWDEERYGQLLAIPGGRRRIRHFLEEAGHTSEDAAALAARLHKRKTDLFRDLAVAGRIPARDGVHRLLGEIAATGMPLAVATTGRRVWVEPLLRRLFGEGRFAVVVTGDDVPALKPHPAAYEVALERLGSRAGTVVAVEDSAHGVAAAVGAGLACLGIVNAYTADQDLSGAALVVDGFGAPGRARVLSGPDDALESGAVTVETLRRVLTRESF